MKTATLRTLIGVALAISIAVTCLLLSAIGCWCDPSLPFVPSVCMGFIAILMVVITAFLIALAVSGFCIAVTEIEKWLRS